MTDHLKIFSLRNRDMPWKEVAKAVGYTGNPDVLRANHNSYVKRNPDLFKGAPEEPEFDERVVILSGKTDTRISSLAELFDFFEIPYYLDDDGEPYSDQYEVISFSVRGNSWDVTMKDPRNPRVPIVSTNYQYQVKAYLRPREEIERKQVIEEIWAEFLKDARKHAPKYKKTKYPKVVRADAKIMVIAVNDPHLGMLAWGKECGIPYDLSIGIRDYRAAFNGLLGISGMYTGVERILFMVGNDLFHVDAPGFDVRGGTRGGATSKGTQQDLDTRLARLFSHVQNLIVGCVDEARLVAPVDVQIIPGNHDRHTMYKFGCVLDAWYRNDKDVTVINRPSVRDYYGYGRNVFMFTHGEEFERKRDNLVSVFATECPPKLWVAGDRCREVLLGHNHIKKEKVYRGDPVNTVWEGRAVRVRSLPGLTPEDSWHFESGYKHRRAATTILYYKDGGVAGLHEFTS